MPRPLWLLLLALGLALWWLGAGSRTPLASGAVVGNGGPVACVPPPRFARTDLPLQSDVGGRMPAFRLGDATVTPLAGLSLQARVLSREDYSLGRESAYSPTDLALGWGAMATPAIGDALRVSQGNRWYRYYWGPSGPPIPLKQIVAGSANMHMIPADASVAAKLARIDAGDTVSLHGWLVRIDADDGWRWQSSLRRDDSGEGACELVFVCSIDG